MSEKSKEATTFHGEATVMRLAMGANILSWLILVAYMLSFVNDLYQVITQWAQISMSLPSDFLGQASAWSGFLRNPLDGLFYFVVLQGLAQVLYLGMDIFYGGEEDVELVEAAE